LKLKRLIYPLPANLRHGILPENRNGAIITDVTDKINLFLDLREKSSKFPKSPSNRAWSDGRKGASSRTGNPKKCLSLSM